MGGGGFAQEQEQEEGQAIDWAAEHDKVRSPIPSVAFAGGQTSAAAIAEPVATLPRFFSPLEPNVIYFGLPSTRDGSIDEAGSGKAFKNWYADLYDASAEAYPLYLELGEVVAAMGENREGWSDTSKAADDQMAQLRALDERTGGGLQEVLGDYLEAEDRVKAAKFAINEALSAATAASHELAEAYELVEEQKQEEAAGKKGGEVKAREKEVRDSVRRVKQILTIAQSVVGIATNPASAPGAMIGIVNTMIDAEDFVDMDVKLWMLKQELAEIQARQADAKRKARGERVEAARSNLDSAHSKIEKEAKNLKAAKLAVGKQVTRLARIEKKNKPKKGKGKASTVLTDVENQSDTTQFLVGVEGDKDPTGEEAASPKQLFGEGTLRALAGELYGIVTSPAFLRADEMDIRLDTDWEVVRDRKETFNIPQEALDSIARWEVVWDGMSRFVRTFRKEHKALAQTLQKLVTTAASGGHFDQRREILTRIANELGVNRE
jgi:hypothetical protein